MNTATFARGIALILFFLSCLSAQSQTDGHNQTGTGPPPPGSFTVEPNLEAHRAIVREMTDARFQALEKAWDQQLQRLDHSSDRVMNTATALILAVTVIVIGSGFLTTISANRARIEAKEYFERMRQDSEKYFDRELNLLERAIESERQHSAELMDKEIRTNADKVQGVTNKTQEVHDKLAALYDKVRSEMKPAAEIYETVDKRIEAYRKPDELRDEIVKSVRAALQEDHARFLRSPQCAAILKEVMAADRAEFEPNPQPS